MKPIARLPPWPQWLGWLPLALALYYLVSSLLGIHEGRWDTLAMDQWRLHDSYLREGMPTGLVIVQNGHRPVIPALLYLADLYWFGGGNAFLVLIGLVFLAAGLFLASRAIWREGEMTTGARVSAISFLWIVTFWFANGRNLVHGNETPFVGLPVLLIAATAWALHRAVERARGGGDGALGATLAVAALCVLTTFTHGVGLVLWIAVLLVALLARLPPRPALTIAVAAVATWVVYFAVLPGGSTGVPAGIVFPDFPLNTLHWLGAPYAHALLTLVHAERVSFEATRAGSIGLGAFAFAAATWVGLARLLRPRRLSPLELWALIVVAMGCGIALQVAILRQETIVELPGTPAAPRYLIWVTCFWAGLFALATRRLGRAGRRWKAWVPAAVVVLVAALLLPAHATYRQVYRGARGRLQEATLALLVGVEDRAKMERFLFRNLRVVRRVAEHLRRDNLAMYRWPEANLVGQRFAGTYPPAPAESVIAGEFAVIAFGDGDGLAGRLQGWALAADSPRRLARVVAVDAAGTIRGVARFTRARPGVVARHGRKGADPRVGFFGYLSDLDAAGEYTFHAIFADDGTAAELRPRPPLHLPGDARGRAEGR